MCEKEVPDTADEANKKQGSLCANEDLGEVINHCLNEGFPWDKNNESIRYWGHNVLNQSQIISITSSTPISNPQWIDININKNGEIDTKCKICKADMRCEDHAKDCPEREVEIEYNPKDKRKEKGSLGNLFDKDFLYDLRKDARGNPSEWID